MRWVWDFADGSRDQRDLLGGKGANIAEMTRVLGADRVPGGFTITTEACVAYMNAGGDLPAGLDEQIAEALQQLETSAGKALGDSADPLLISARSGARESMPGMLDTILNIGLNDETVAGFAALTQDDRFAWDCYRRLLQMYGNVVAGVETAKFETLLTQAKSGAGVQSDSELPAEALQELVAEYSKLYEFPQDPRDQLDGAIRAVFASWLSERAVSYRRINGIPDDWGTAVNIQRMVFGNKGETSGSGVAFSRDEISGASQPSGEFLINAQGEDVVSGVRNTLDLAEMEQRLPESHAQLLETLKLLEVHYGDMQDTEFTVEEGRLYMLQTRAAKRPAQAAVQFATDAAEEGLLDRRAALATIDATSLDALLHPALDAAADPSVLARGVAASPGAAQGTLVFSAAEAIAAREEGRDVILTRHFTEADDVAGFHAARGILTAEGGKSSHAALVARGMGVPAVTGASSLAIDAAAGSLSVGDVKLGRGDRVTIDGSRGIVTLDDVELTEPKITEEFDTVLSWADALAPVAVRANADTPEDSTRARELGAVGIGLCRTEHMFLGARQPLMAAMILAEDDVSQAEELDKLLPLQRDDFVAIFEAMSGLPVTVRLLDPPLHEFLPAVADVERKLTLATGDEAVLLKKLATRLRSLQEVNPMLGLRGVRLAITQPQIYAMQVKALCQAAKLVTPAPQLEIMIPLVAYEREITIIAAMIERVAGEEGLERGKDFSIGTMIELPRACLIAGRIAEEVDFMSFGTNDLTQTALGFSRDDIEAKILGPYLDAGILNRSPFETLDTPGVGDLILIARRLAREVKPDIKLGICGEHGGDPDSIAFFAKAGLDYVSCSPYRVPIARVAAAQATAG